MEMIMSDLMNLCSISFRYEFKDCNFKSMRTTKHLSGKIVLILAFQIIVAANLQAQNETTSTTHTFVPLPELLLSSEGYGIESSEQWEEIRRSEILELFREHVYGRVPEAELSIGFELKFIDMNALAGTAIQKEVEVQVSNGPDTHVFTILIFLPKDIPGPVPLFLGLNFNGNHTIHSNKQITVTDSWVRNNSDLEISDHRAREGTRGAGAHRWPVEHILSRGYGVATIYYGEIDPDFDDGFKNGIHRLFADQGEERDSDSWGSIATWAWGLSRAMDYFETDADVDQKRVGVMGHSRLGKTSLWAGAEDERFALVISNNSGCGGAALTRRAFGERVSRINTSFPHWFASRFHEYNDNEAALPVDQHMLMALMAPRPLYVASAQEDLWADPYGEYLSLYYGSKVYELYGNVALKSDQLPGVDQPRWSGSLGYHMRTGKHDVTSYDWEQYLKFADQNMPGAESGQQVSLVSEAWLKEHIKSGSPRLMLTPDLEVRIREKLHEGDPVTLNGFQLLQGSADDILDLSPLSYSKTGRRLLGVSREAIRRLTTLALVYRFEKEQRYLDKLEEELVAVCGFNDWNPSHFLDVAEMAAGVALALDWAGEWLTPETEQMVRSALVEKALKPGMSNIGYNGWVDAHHNWNLVCHGGLSLAALALFEDEPELTARVLNRAVEKIPLALEPYGPGGVYPEGPSYWFYATTYLVGAISAFESALGTDFGLADARGLMESAVFSQVLAGPSGDYYNYFDSGLGGLYSMAHFGLLSWFASRSGEGMDWTAYRDLLERELTHPAQVSRTRFFSMHFLDIARMDHTGGKSFIYPEVWTGGGDEPICIFRDRENQKDAFFLAAKGGRAADNHGNMDAGSFIFELEGVRWVVDPGNQGYHELEQLMGNELWNSGQESGRWKLLTKNNFGHSTLTVNGKMHMADGRATLIRVDRRRDQPKVTFDLTPLYGEDLAEAQRSFIRVSDHGLRIRDHLIFSPKTQTVTWQLMTRAEVEVQDRGVVLRQEGKTLYLNVLSDLSFEVNVVNLSPPPLPYDKNISGLKRIEIQVDRKAFPGFSGEFVVDLTTKKK